MAIKITNLHNSLTDLPFHHEQQLQCILTIIKLIYDTYNKMHDNNNNWYIKLKKTPVKDILFWTTIASAPLGLIQLLLVTHTNQLLGIPDSYLIYGDDVVLAVLGQFAFLPTLVLAASICPPGVEAVLFACLMSVFNGAGVLGTEVGAYLTKFLGISGGDGGDGFDNLGLLIVLCNVSSLLPLAFIGLLDDTTSTGNDEDNGGINNDVVDEVEIVEEFS